MKVYMIPSISCPICYYQFNVVQEGDQKIAKLVHEPHYMYDKHGPLACPQVGMTSLIDLAPFEKELLHVTS